MIPEVTAALRALLAPMLPTGVTLSSTLPAASPAAAGPTAPDLPTASPAAAGQTARGLPAAGPAAAGLPMVSLLLAGIVADTRAMPGDWADLRDPDNRVIGRQPPARRFDLRYLVTAWAADPATEEHLLDVVLRATAERRRLDPAPAAPATSGSPPGDQSAPGDQPPGGSAPDGCAPGGWVEPMWVHLADSGPELCQNLGLPPRTLLALTVNAAVLPAPDLNIEPQIEHRTVHLTPR